MSATNRYVEAKKWQNSRIAFTAAINCSTVHRDTTLIVYIIQLFTLDK